MESDSTTTDTWSAGRWQRANADSFAAWRASGRSLVLPQLSSLCDAITATTLLLSDGADRLADKLLGVLENCDNLEFGSADEVAAYATLHLADRYGRVTQVLERLFAAGHLPIRKRRLSVLEVGAGPAPGLYAAHDFYDDLVLWVAASGQQVEVSPVTELNAVDRGTAWGLLLHRLSEMILVERWDSPSAAKNLPFGTTYTDFSGFSIRRHHQDALEERARAIFEDFDECDEPISLGYARQLSQEEGASAPSAYDLVIVCNFVTSIQATQHFQDEIRDLARGLTPGGLLMVLGATSAHYPEIWARVKEIVESVGLTALTNFAGPIRANDDPSRAAIIRRQVLRDLVEIRQSGGQLPEKLETLDPGYQFPYFRAMVWKNQAGRRRRMAI